MGSMLCSHGTFTNGGQCADLQIYLAHFLTVLKLGPQGHRAMGPTAFPSSEPAENGKSQCAGTGYLGRGEACRSLI